MTDTTLKAGTPQFDHQIKILRDSFNIHYDPERPALVRIGGPKGRIFTWAEAEMVFSLLKASIDDMIARTPQKRTS